MPLTKEESDILNNYFNLCSEEYLLYSKGYIYPEVWQSWCSGMSYYLKNKRVRDKWNEEEKGNSYYGLTLDIIEKQRKQATT